MANYNINNLPYDLPELLNSSSDPDLSTIFDNSKKRILYFYPIHSLYKDNDSNKINFAPNIVKIGFLDIDEQKQAIAYEVTNFKSQLKASNLNDSNDNPITQFNYIDQKQLITQDLDLLNQFKLYAISINNPVTENNIDDLYLLNYYEQPYQGTETISTKTITITKIKDFTTNGGNPMIIKLQKPFDKDTQITGIKIKAPRSTLFGNIKVLGKVDGMEVWPKLVIKDKVLFPLLSMPIETQPKIRILEQWFTDFVLPWDSAKKFLKETSVLDLIKIGKGTETRKLPIPKARTTNFWITYDNTSPPTPSWPLGKEAEIKDKEIFETDSGILGKVYISSTDKFHDIEVEIKDAPTIDSLGIVLLNMLTYTYTLNRNFDGFTPDKLNTKIAELRTKFEGQKPDEVITNLFKQWELDYPNYVNLSQVKIFKQIIIMLSKYIYSSLSINKGLNDDFKLLLPYYFELKSNPLHSTSDQVWEFKDAVVILKSEYFDFSDPNNIKLKNNDISQNQLFRLDDNQFNWLPIINQLETNNIPSLIPADWTLGNGEFGKYFTNLIISKNNIEKVLNLYGSNNSQLFSKLELYKIISQIETTNNFELEIENSVQSCNRIEISGIFGSGNYNLTLITSENQEIILNDINLFDSTNESISYINIEI